MNKPASPWASIVPHLNMAVRLKQFKPGDHLVLSDATLAAAVRHERALDRAEYVALLDSPLTLRRLRVLAVNLVADLATSNQSGGEFLLLAAATDEASYAMLSDNGAWQVEFLRGKQGWWMVLKALDDSGMEEQAEWQVVGSDGSIWLHGMLNENGELSAAWPGSDAPLPTIKRLGGRFQVRRSN